MHFYTGPLDYLIFFCWFFRKNPLKGTRLASLPARGQAQSSRELDIFSEFYVSSHQQLPRPLHNFCLLQLAYLETCFFPISQESGPSSKRRAGGCFIMLSLFIICKRGAKEELEDILCIVKNNIYHYVMVCLMMILIC